MRTKKYKVRLGEQERKELEGITKRGKHSAATIKRANILLNLDENHGSVKPQAEIAAQLNSTTATIYTVSKQYVQEGLQAILKRKVREKPPRQPIATGDVEARIIALARGEAPAGRTRWALRLLEKKVVEPTLFRPCMKHFPLPEPMPWQGGWKSITRPNTAVG